MKEDDIELARAWIELNAPERIKYDLIRGLSMVFAEREKDRRIREKYPRKGQRFTNAECKKLMEIEGELTGFPLTTIERDIEVEVEFGRPMKSLKARIRYIRNRRSSATPPFDGTPLSAIHLAASNKKKGLQP